MDLEEMSALHRGLFLETMLLVWVEQLAAPGFSGSEAVVMAAVHLVTPEAWLLHVLLGRRRNLCDRSSCRIGLTVSKV